MELAIENLSKRYGDLVALQEITLKSGPGLIGLVGPNGAGKTTFMRIIATLLPPTGGTVRWNNLDTRTNGEAVRQGLGYLPQNFGLYPEFSGRKFLRYLAAMKGLPKELAHRRVDEVLEMVNLEKVADRKQSTYSGGMRQRIGIAQALLNDPELLIVDEPTVGLDPAERVRFRTLLASLTDDRLIILSTHIICDVEAVANRLVILKEGRLLQDTSAQKLLQAAVGQVWSVTTDPATALQLQNGYLVSSLVTQPDCTHLKIISPERPHESALPADPALEDAYLLAVHTERISG